MPLELLKSYFSGWSQCVCYGGVTASVAPQELGVIQGSPNGPLFFDIYSNDINYLWGNYENILFADDTCLVHSNNDLGVLFEHVNDRLSIILNRCRYNKLAINPAKSECVGYLKTCFNGTTNSHREWRQQKE